MCLGGPLNVDNISVINKKLANFNEKFTKMEIPVKH